MNLIFKEGENMFNYFHEIEAFVNPVNCEGVMGKGLALEFKNKFPKNYKYYREVCLAKNLQPGQILTNIELKKHIYNFATKDSWKQKSQLNWIDTGMGILIDMIALDSINSIAIPKLGCGLGGLNWEDVEPIVIKHLLKLKHPAFPVVYLF